MSTFRVLALSREQKIKIFCYVCASIQAAILLASFLNFSTVTNVVISESDQADLPSISLCFFYRLANLSYEIFEGQKRSSMTLGEINKVLPKYEQFVVLCSVLNNNYEYEDCIDVSKPVIEYISLNSKCYSLFAAQEPALIYRKKQVGSNWLVKIVLNVSILTTNRIGIYLSHNEDELDNSLISPSLVQFNINLNNQAVVTYERTDIKKLPKPYDTNCYEYGYESCHSRNTCVKRCLRERSFRAHKAWPSSRYVITRPEFKDGRFVHDLAEHNFTKFCLEKYPYDDCNIQIHHAIQTSLLTTKCDTNDTFQINVAYPSGTDIFVEHIGMETAMEFTLFLLSIINLWTEFSMIKLSSQVMFHISNLFSSPNCAVQMNSSKGASHSQADGKFLVYRNSKRSSVQEPFPSRRPRAFMNSSSREKQTHY